MRLSRRVPAISRYTRAPREIERGDLRARDTRLAGRGPAASEERIRNEEEDEKETGEGNEKGREKTGKGPAVGWGARSVELHFIAENSFGIAEEPGSASGNWSRPLHRTDARTARVLVR